MTPSKYRPPDLINKTVVLGVKIDDIPMEAAVNKAASFLRAEKQHAIFTPNPEICLKAFQDEKFLHILNHASLNLPDGFGLKFGAKILGEKLENRVPGVDFCEKFLKKINEMAGAKIFILRRSDSLAAEADIKSLFAKNFPRITLGAGEWPARVGTNEEGIIRQINSFNPQILFVLLGAPEQEIWIDKFLTAMPSVKIAIGCGGAFDFLAGKMKRAPQSLRSLGLEWLYRLYLEPTRLKRIKNATAGFLLACHIWQKRMQTTFRDNVCAIIKNNENQYLIAKSKVLENHWQFPQGGVRQGELKEAAILREIEEEMGIAPKNFTIIKQLPETHEYLWPTHARMLKGYKGQRQTIFLLQFSGAESDFKLEKSEEIEKIKWVDKEKILENLHPIRREIGRKVIKYL